MSLITLCEKLQSKRSCIDFLLEKHLIRPAPQCPTCEVEMVLGPRPRLITTGYVWKRANRRRENRCNREKSLLVGSIFSNARMDIRKVVMLIYEWASNTPQSVIEEKLEIDHRTVVTYVSDLRNICSWRLLQNPITLGGFGVHVEIDESLFARPKYNQGHAVHLPPVWIFGIYQPNIQKGYLQLVNSRDADSLMPIIERIILPGTVINSDQWPAYNRILGGQQPAAYQHITVNHREHYVDPVSGATTNHIEAYWSRAKKHIKAANGMQRHIIPKFLDEYMWRERYGANVSDAFNNILRDISAFYHV